MSEKFNTGDTFLDIFLGKLRDAAVELELMFVGGPDKKFHDFDVQEIVAQSHKIVHARTVLYQYLKDNNVFPGFTPDVQKVLDHVSTVLYRVSGTHL